ncbi:MAG TPA: (Fe-S)-binding protein [Acidimicrobiia bacterium]|nr:(Fe-S)-binding protein [Acidimicrobiia bacterium]
MPPVALFVTCVVDLVTPDTGFAAVRLLEAAGCEVVFPAGQTCCGQPAVSAGEPEAARRLARHFVKVFEPFETVVAPSGSCAAMVHHWYPELLDGAWRRRAESVAARTYELSQYLVEVLGRTDLGATVDGTVTVHDACHGLRHLGVRDAPRVLLTAAGATVVEMTEAETCCGFGGTFGVGHGVLAGALADDKLGYAAATGASCVVACDQACLLHLEGRRRRGTVGPAPTHLADLLAAGLP